MTTMHQGIRNESDRQVSRVSAAVRRFTPQLVEALDTALSDDGWDVSADCIEATQRSLVRVLESRLETLQQAVDARRQVAQNGKRLRRDRDRAAEEVYDLLVRLRHIVRGLGGGEAERAVFDAGKTPREPKKVALTAWELARRMASGDTRQELCRRFSGETVLDGWLEEMAEPLARLFRLLDRVRLLEQDEATAVQDVRRARAAMRRAKKSALRILEELYELAELDELAGKIRHREPDTRETKRSASKPAETAAETTKDSVDRAPAIPEPAPKPASEPRPWVSEEAWEAPRSLRPVLVDGVAGDAEASTSSPETSSLAPRAGRAAAPDLVATTPRESSETPESTGTTHPVRKVLDWLRVAPHRGETPAESASPATSREEAA